MILNIFATLFVLGITFVHSMFGLYSGIINVFCSITALAVAFGFYEQVNLLLTEQGLDASYTEACALVGLFVITLGVLRTLADMYLRGNVRVPMYADWGGGAVCGFLNAQIAVGIMVIGVLMLPFGGQVGLFVREQRDAENFIDPATERVEFHRQGLWFRSDQFAVGLFNLLSSGSLRGATTLKSVYPDYTQWVFWSGNTVQHESPTAPIRDGANDGFKSGIRVESWWHQPGTLVGRYRKQAPTKENSKPNYEEMEYKIESGRELLGVRLVLRPLAAEQGAKRGDAAFHRFRPTMIRLVGDVRGKPRQYAAQIVGGAISEQGLEDKLIIAERDKNFSMRADGDQTIDVWFEVDAGFEPHFIEYRRHARAAMTAAQAVKSPPEDRLVAAGGGGPSGGGGGGASGATRFIDAVISSRTGGTDRLPFNLAGEKLTSQAEHQGDRLIRGRVTGSEEDLRSRGADDRLERFDVPEGQRIFQLQTKVREAQSLAGQVFNFVGGVVNQYQCVSSTGDSFPLVGYYAIVEMDGKEYLELNYAPDDPSFRGMLDFQNEEVRKLLRSQDQARVGLLFLVPPGTCVTGVKTQGGKIDFETEYCVSK